MYLGILFVKWGSDRKVTITIVNWIISLPCFFKPPKAFHFSKLFTLALRTLPGSYLISLLPSLIRSDHPDLIPILWIYQAPSLLGASHLLFPLSETLFLSLRPQPKCHLLSLKPSSSTSGTMHYTSQFYFHSSSHRCLMIIFVRLFHHCLLLPLEYKNMNIVILVVSPASRTVADT